MKCPFQIILNRHQLEIRLRYREVNLTLFMCCKSLGYEVSVGSVSRQNVTATQYKPQFISESVSCIRPTAYLHPTSFLGIIMGLKMSENIFQANI